MPDVVPQIKVMISSTRADLMQYREEASRVIKRVAQDFEKEAQLVEISMEREVQRGDRELAIAVSKRWVEESDWIVLIVGWHYGTVCTEPDAEGLSVTEWEFSHAVGLKKKTFAFVAGEPQAANEYRASRREKVDLKDWKDRQDQASREKLKSFKDSLASAHLEYFRNLGHFSERLEKTLTQAIKTRKTVFGELPPGVLIPNRQSIQKCIEKVKLIATSKRIHDHLHELRQNVIRPIVESALVQWRTDGQLGVAVATLIGLKIGFAEARIRDIADEKQNLDDETGKVLLGALAGVEGANPSVAFQNSTPDLNEFARKIGRFATFVQTAFSLTDAVLRKDSNQLNELHTSLLADFKSAIEGCKFGPVEDAKLNDVLQRAESNRKRLIRVLDTHHDWQYQHDKLDMLNGYRRNEDFRDQLDNYLSDDSLSSMVESAKALLEQEDVNPILAERLPVLGTNLAQLYQTRELPAFDSMRKTFDDVFYQIDKRTLAAVQESEQRVRDLESRLEEMVQQHKARQQTEAA